MRSRSYRYRTVALLLALGIVLVGHGSTQAAKELRLKMKQGDKFQVQMTQQAKQTIQTGETPIDVSQDMGMQMSWLVSQVDDDGTIHLEQTIDRIAMTMQMPGQGELKFDSASQEEPQGIAKMIGDMLKPMVGAKMTQTMNDRGEVRDFKVAEEALKGMSANPMMKQFLSEDSFKEMMTKGSAVLPEQAIEKGHTWTSAMEVNNPLGKIKTDASYVYQGEEERGGTVLDKIGLKFAMSFGEGAGFMGAKIKMTDQDSSGTMYFDAQAGHFAETEIKQKMTLEITFGEKQIKQQVDSTMRMTTKRVESAAR